MPLQALSTRSDIPHGGSFYLCEYGLLWGFECVPVSPTLLWPSYLFTNIPFKTMPLHVTPCQDPAQDNSHEVQSSLWDRLASLCYNPLWLPWPHYFDFTALIYVPTLPITHITWEKLLVWCIIAFGEHIFPAMVPYIGIIVIIKITTIMNH